MGRPELHSHDAILDAACSVILERGARATTVKAIAQASGAPKGSIYHRFASQEDLLAAMWIRAVRRSQDAFMEALEAPDATSAAVAGALALHDFANHDPANARLLASLRREDVLQRVTSPALARELAELNRPIEDALKNLASRLFGRATHATVERTLCAAVDLPLGATRRHLIAGTPLPRNLRGQLEAAVRAALEPPERSPDA